MPFNTPLNAPFNRPRRARLNVSGDEVSLKWCPGHSGIFGHDPADLEAKSAARGKRYDPSWIPSILRTRPPLKNPVTLKRTIKDENQNNAILFWRPTPAGEKFHRRYALLSPFNFLAHTSKLPRSWTTLLFRLITGHVQLNQHLHRLQAVGSPDCAGCPGSPETVAHFLLRCPCYSAERYLYLESADLEPFSLDYLFYASQATCPLFDFIKATGRFSDSLR